MIPALNHVMVRYLLLGTVVILFGYLIMERLSKTSRLVQQPPGGNTVGHTDVKELLNGGHHLANDASKVGISNIVQPYQESYNHKLNNNNNSDHKADQSKNIQFSKTKTSCISEDEFEPVAYICKKGETGWTREMMRDLGDEFLKMYATRPKDNPGGTQLNTQFAIWFTVKQIKPKHIIESGSWSGMGTWLLRQAAPDAQLNVVDPNTPSYTDKRSNSRYYTGENFKDFMQIDWVQNGVDPSQTLVFFDDHQAASKRILQARERGFRHIIFDDNYFPHLPFDAFSAKETCDAAGCFKAAVGIKTDPVLFIDDFKRFKSNVSKSKVMSLAKQVRDSMDVYYELPPLIGIAKNDGTSENGRPTWSTLAKMELGAPIYQFLEKPIYNLTETAHILQTATRPISDRSYGGSNNNCCYIRVNLP